MVKALDLRSNGRIVRVGSNPTPGNFFGVVFLFFLHISNQTSQVGDNNFLITLLPFLVCASINPANESEARLGRGLDATPQKGKSNLTPNHIL